MCVFPCTVLKCAYTAVYVLDNILRLLFVTFFHKFSFVVLGIYYYQNDQI